MQKKVQIILDLQPSTTLKQLRSFSDMVQFYRDMQKRRSYILVSLTNLVEDDKKKLNWTEVYQTILRDIKKVMAKEAILTYPNFNEVFEIHTEASDRQLGAVISQNGKPLSFYSRELSSSQRNYTTTEQELLSIVETLKEFKNIMLGKKNESLNGS